MWYQNHMEESGTKNARKSLQMRRLFCGIFFVDAPLRALSCTISHRFCFSSLTHHKHTHTNTHTHSLTHKTHTHKDTQLDVSLSRLGRECETAQLGIIQPACVQSSRFTKSREWHICANVTLVFGRGSHNRKHKKVTQPELCDLR